jgi:hypothetical protein
MQVEVLFPDIVPMDPAGERPRSGGDMDDSSLFSNMARRFRTPPDMMTDVQNRELGSSFVLIMGSIWSATAASTQHKLRGVGQKARASGMVRK